MVARRFIIGSTVLLSSACAAESPPPQAQSAATPSSAPTTEASAAPREHWRCGGFSGIGCPMGLACKMPEQDGSDLMGTCVPSG